MFIAGAAIQWLRDGLGLIDDASESEAMAAGLESNAGVYFVPAFVGLGAPHWVPDARGALFGLTRGTTREHVVRAALEAMAYGTHEVLAAMEVDSSTNTTELRVDGGAAKNDWLMSFQAGLLGISVRRPEVVETNSPSRRGSAWSSCASASNPSSTRSTPARRTASSTARGGPACQKLRGDILGFFEKH